MKTLISGLPRLNSVHHTATNPWCQVWGSVVTFDHGPDRDLVVGDTLVEAAEDTARRGRDERGLVVVAGERPDRRQRLPQGQHGELDAIGGITPEDVAVHVALDLAQPRKGLLAKVLLVANRVARCGPPVP